MKENHTQKRGGSLHWQKCVSVSPKCFFEILCYYKAMKVFILLCLEKKSKSSSDFTNPLIVHFSTKRLGGTPSQTPSSPFFHLWERRDPKFDLHQTWFFLYQFVALGVGIAGKNSNLSESLCCVCYFQLFFSGHFMRENACVFWNSITCSKMLQIGIFFDIRLICRRMNKTIRWNIICHPPCLTHLR